MNQEKRNQYLVVGIVVILLIAVFCVGIYEAVKYNNKRLKEQGYIFNQIYFSEYTLDMIDEKYFIGYIGEKQVNVIVDQYGKEVFSNGVDLYYDDIYKTKEGNYLFYNNRNNRLVAYTFNGQNIDKVLDINDVLNVKPIIYTNNNIEYILGFSSTKDGSLQLYMLNNSGIISIPDVTLMYDHVVSNKNYVYSDKYIVVSNSEQLYAIYDLVGNKVVDFEYKDIKNTLNNSFIVKNSKGKYGIIDINKKELVKIKYKAIDVYNNNYLVVDGSNMAIFNNNYENITGFKMKYDSTIEFNLRNDNSMHLWHVGNNFVVVNNYLQDMKKIEYTKRSAYFIKNNKITNTIKQVGFENNGLVYSFNDEYLVTFYGSELDEDYSIQLKNVNKLLSISNVTIDTIKVLYLNKENKEEVKYYKKGKEIEFNYGTSLFFNEDYEIIFNDKDEVSIYNLDMKKIDSLEGNNVIYKNNYLIVDSGIYRIEKKS